jgi:hypothetical protein
MEFKFSEYCAKALSGADFFFKSSSRSQLGTGRWYRMQQEQFKVKQLKKSEKEAHGRKKWRHTFFDFSATLKGVFGSVGNTSVTLPTPNAAGGT